MLLVEQADQIDRFFAQSIMPMEEKNLESD